MNRKELNDGLKYHNNWIHLVLIILIIILTIYKKRSTTRNQVGPLYYPSGKLLSPEALFRILLGFIFAVRFTG